ncbi:hypothetical protein [Nocardioides sp. ChNu-99]|uniref:hypothetical protein n=1 Tax=Nocardioides sp. ChNu-99 TaxID=2839897 RepID=UPI0024054A06|nr:hypothetical protein [Nocardioides sp. ChNu-99]MDF9715871.1 hypothetical protein [Nocardioides sp. ChNu-99]
MSERGLVYHEASLDAIAQTLRDATDEIRTFIADLAETVDRQTAGWSEETGSRVAQRRTEQRLSTDVDSLAEALTQVVGEVESHAERCREAEVRNAALLG